VAPREIEFIRRWIGDLRRAPDERVRRLGVLVRPHPANDEQWSGVDFSDLGDVAIWSSKTSAQADQGLYDSIHHSGAVVGLNTSAMIEAAIVGRPVLTIAAPEFAGGQQGTLHFWYLLAERGGIVLMARGIDEHLQQLAAALADEEAVRERSRRFVESFVRPRGLDRPAAPIMVEEIERVGAIRKHQTRTPLWHYPLRWSLRTAARTRFAGR
jgi:hypothetical protein